MTPFVLVVGAGQAGLAAGFHLKRAGLSFRILEAGDRIGNSWRNRYASLTLFTPRAFSALPGLSLEGDPAGYASRDEFASYLEAYAGRHSLPVTLGARVTRLGRSSSAGFDLALATGTTIAASHVIVASGGFQRAIVPRVSEGLGLDVLQLTAGTYRDPSQVPGGPVLVVGDGATGRDIAVELAAGHPTMLATGKPRKLFPERLLGKSKWWWLNTLGLMGVTDRSPIGRIMRRADPFPNRGRSLDSLRSRGVRMLPRLVAATGRTVTFSNATSTEVGTVIWATGYCDDTDWVDLPGAIAPGDGFLQSQGISPVPGLYFVGRPWQRNRASALVMGAGDDARRIVAAIAGDIASLGRT